ncbi:DUF4349 domain-containing protein [Clostridium sp. 'deep sea']|uniref:DUF4349 domain-containing protein n=1 Tax=Clostridium sp. 'deep sea' TaxID=2779445 RepID=UPI001896A1AD|nr:DUF4349 domain-containing protein [Clostridium sp. 'deep sea']QOR35574.1 DUF4349 domain-containing protein [Clostridium sp. 'deep sea']
MKNESTTECNDVPFELKQPVQFDFSVTDESGYPVNIKGGSTVLSNGAKVNYTSNDQKEIAKKIIKTGSLSLDVFDLDKVTQDIKDLIVSRAGYIQSSKRHEYEKYNRLNMIIRVPVNNFDSLYEQLLGLGEVTLDQTQSQDVTEDYYDQEIRLKSLNAKKDSLTKLFEKAKNVSEILQIENELNRVIYEIEKVKGRLQYLDRNVAMSSISISVFERNPTATIEKNSIERLKFALKDGWSAMLNFSIKGIAALIWIIPFSPLIIIAIFICVKLWRIIKKRYRLKKSKNDKVI